MQKRVLTIITIAIFAAIAIFYLVIIPKQFPLLSPYQSNFDFTAENNTLKVTAAIKDGTVNFNLLYWDKTAENFVLLGRSPSEILATSATLEITFIEQNISHNEYHEYFIASYNSSAISDSYLLRAKIFEGSPDLPNHIDLEKKSGSEWTEVCKDKRQGDTCYIGNINLNITNIIYTVGGEESATFNASANTNFRYVFDNEGNYFKLPLQSELPSKTKTIIIYNSANEPIEAYIFAYNGTSVNITDITCIPNYTTHNTSCTSAEVYTKYYIDENNCGLNSETPANETIDCDHNKNGIIGTISSISEHNLGEIEIEIDSDELELSENYTSEETVEIFEDGETIVEFEWDFDDAPLNLKKIEFEKQRSNDDFGYLIVNGIPVEKEIHIDRVANFSKICVIEKEIDDIDDISDDCDESREEIIACPGEKSNIECEIDDDKLIITGLRNSAAMEYELTLSSCTPNWNCTAWSACTNNQQTRVCTDRNSCGTLSGKPSQTQTCSAQTGCTPDWDCTEWKPETCPKNKTQTRICTDSNNCGTAANKPSETKTCTYEKSNTGIIILVIILAVLIFGAVVTIFFVLRKSQPKPQPPIVQPQIVQQNQRSI